MSLTHPNTPVSQQDLHDFYNKIKPYMGSYPSAIVSKFKKSDLYSTEEKMIGQWTDGKPLYQKVVFADGISTGDQVNRWVTTSLAFPSNVDVMVDARAILADSLHESDSNIIIAHNYSNDTIEFGLLNNYWVGRAIDYFIFKYTKTTDTATSIGEDTDYSTDEKIIGTWIDGSPVYQRTWTGTTGTGTSSDLFTIANADKIINQEGYLYNGGYYFDLNYSQGTDNYFDIFVKDNVVKQRKQNNTNYDYVITIQYTKATT